MLLEIELIVEESKTKKGVSVHLRTENRKEDIYMKRNRGVDSSSHVENNINPTVSRLVNEVNTLLTVHELQSKLTRLPSDLPSVKKVKEEIRNFLTHGSLAHN
jgi:hypothetical protein